MSSSELVRRRVNGYECCLARPVGNAELEGLVGALAHPERPAPGVLKGRGAICIHAVPSIGTVVIKEYVRGGAFRFLLRRYYVRRGKTRPEREIEILKAAQAAGLNVPEPIGCLLRGGLVYRGWLVTRLIPGRGSLADIGRAEAADLGPLVDQVVLQMRLLIEHRIAHVDLHPGNVLVDGNGGLHLLDFDKATHFRGGADRLRDYYLRRWNRAVVKHGLPAVLSDRLASGLHAALT